MKHTFSELLGEVLKRNNMNAYLQQNKGKASWLWMGGECNSMVEKDFCVINNLFSIRKPLKAIRKATINTYKEPSKLTMVDINKLLKIVSAKWSTNYDKHGRNSEKFRGNLQQKSIDECAQRSICTSHR